MTVLDKIATRLRTDLNALSVGSRGASVDQVNLSLQRNGEQWIAECASYGFQPPADTALAWAVACGAPPCSEVQRRERRIIQPVTQYLIRQHVAEVRWREE